jgi:hypothetical protein
MQHFIPLFLYSALSMLEFSTLSLYGQQDTENLRVSHPQGILERAFGDT